MTKKVKVLGKYYTVKRVPANSDFLNNGEFHAKVHGSTNTIYMDKDLNPQMELEVILHEVAHVLDRALTLKLEEAGVTRLSEGLLALVVDNKDLFKIRKSR